MAVDKYILSVNCGSSSLKYKLFQLAKDLELLIEGQVANIGAQDEEAQLTYQAYQDGKENGQTVKKGLGKNAQHEECLKGIVQYLTDPEHEPKSLTNVDTIEVITHR